MVFDLDAILKLSKTLLVTRGHISISYEIIKKLFARKKPMVCEYIINITNNIGTTIELLPKNTTQNNHLMIYICTL